MEYCKSRRPGHLQRNELPLHHADPHKAGSCSVLFMQALCAFTCRLPELVSVRASMRQGESESWLVCLCVCVYVREEGQPKSATTSWAIAATTLPPFFELLLATATAATVPLPGPIPRRRPRLRRRQLLLLYYYYYYYYDNDNDYYYYYYYPYYCSSSCCCYCGYDM